MDEKGENQKPQFNCLLRALLERFNTIRTGRIHQQFINIKTYKAAFFTLMFTAILLIINGHMLFPDIVNKEISMPEFEESISKGESINKTKGIAKKGFYYTGKLLIYPYKVFQLLIKTNILAFIFFGGLIGGFFSVASRKKTRERKPGEDTYFVWYILSKPFIGAFGAVILFLLIQSDFVQLEILKKSNGEDIKRVVAFSVAFLAGFSERIVFPNLR
jgi:hypothetical protein